MTVSEFSPPALEVYVYGVARAGAVDAAPALGVGPVPSPLRTVTRNGLSAIISDVPDGELAATREDLYRHTEVLQSLMGQSTILPMRFGTVMPDERTVGTELLAARQDELEQLLELLAGKVELTLSASYSESALARIAASSPEIVRLNQRLQAVSAEAGYYERIRLGELVANALQAQRDRDSAEILAHLRPHAVDVVEGRPAHERAVINAAFLVDAQALERFDAVADEVAEEHADHMSFRYTGPLPPFSFVQLEERLGWG